MNWKFNKITIIFVISLMNGKLKADSVLINALSCFNINNDCGLNIKSVSHQQDN